MTIGSYDRSVFTTITGGRVGVEDTKTWSGVDSPRVSRPKWGKRVVRRGYQKKDGTWKIKTHVLRYPMMGTGTSESALLTRRPDNPYTMERFFHRDAPARIHPSLGVTDYAFLQWNMTRSNGLPSLFTSNDQIRLVSKLREKLYGSDFNMSVFLGEARQSLGMITSTAIRIAQAGYYLRKGDVQSASRSLIESPQKSGLRQRKANLSRDHTGLNLNTKNVKSDSRNTSGNWLELQYGWLPLLSDVAAAAEQLAHHLEIPKRISYKVRIHREVNDRYDNTQGLAWGLGTVSTVTKKSHDRWLVARISENDHPTTAKKLGLLNPELVAWELMPFSFVADWFIPIGGYLEARALASGLSGTFITSELKKLSCRSSDVSIVGGVNGQVFPDPPQNLSYVRAHFDRSISSSLSVPMPSFKPLSKVASWQHCVNAVALVTQVFTSGKDYTPAQLKLLRNPRRLPQSHWET